MANLLFVSGLSILLGGLLFWGVKVLPKERWQILAAVPRGKREDNTWEGINFTYYGFLVAGAYVLSVAILFILLGAFHLSITSIFLVAVLIAVFCLPASKIIAAVVEGKPHTLTIGGASFVGIILSPWLVYFASKAIGPRIGIDLPVMPVLAALSIAFSFGEGLGRLACISFGCCYGKPLSQSHPMVRFLFRKKHFVFYGKTKKIAYADGLDQEPVIPIQAVSSVIYVGTALVGTYLFLSGMTAVAFLITLLTNQFWRFFSEFLRADYRGHKRRISAYQWMSLLGAGYGVFLFFRFEDTLPFKPDVLSGLGALINPVILIFLQGLWLVLFFFTGRSMVTGATISIHVRNDRI